MLPILTADDYAMTDGVSRSIEALANARRLSATSVMTTMPDWPSAARRLREFRDRLAVGLHLNLTLGAPAEAMPRLCPQGMLPPLQTLMRAAVLGHLSPDEIRAEIARQFDAFEQHFGFPPDHVDGHQHVQVLPVIRHALIAEVASRYADRPPLLRNPSDVSGGSFGFGMAGAKTLLVKLLATGFTRSGRSGGMPVNSRFAGFSAFDMSVPYATELASALSRGDDGKDAWTIIMCHPGYADAALAAIDPVVERRQQEHDALMAYDALPGRIWHVDRPANGGAVDWSRSAQS